MPLQDATLNVEPDGIEVIVVVGVETPLITGVIGLLIIAAT